MKGQWGEKRSRHSCEGSAQLRVLLSCMHEDKCWEGARIAANQLALLGTRAGQKNPDFQERVVAWKATAGAGRRASALADIQFHPTFALDPGGGALSMTGGFEIWRHDRLKSAQTAQNKSLAQLIELSSSPNHAYFSSISSIFFLNFVWRVVFSPVLHSAVNHPIKLSSF